MYFQGEVDGVNPPATAKAMPDKFSGEFELVTVEGVGHFIQREAPDRVAEKLVTFLRPMLG
jgi:pimeloyl-ACP methyl ester carboxylesterase